MTVRSKASVRTGNFSVTWNQQIVSMASNCCGSKSIGESVRRPHAYDGCSDRDVEKLLTDRRCIACGLSLGAQTARSVYTNTRIYVSNLHKYWRLFGKYDARSSLARPLRRWMAMAVGAIQGLRSSLGSFLRRWRPADKFVSVSINALVRVHSMSFPSDSNCLVYQLCVHMNLKQIIIMQHVCSYVVECVYFKL